MNFKSHHKLHSVANHTNFQAKEQKEDLHKRVLDFSNALDKAQMQVTNSDVKRTLVRAKSCVSEAADSLEKGLERQNSLVRTSRI